MIFSVVIALVTLIVPSPEAGRGPGGDVIGGRGSAVQARDDMYRLETYDPSYLPVFRNDTYPRQSQAEWEEGSYGSVALENCGSEESCFVYQPHYSGVTDRFRYTLVSPDGSRSTATVTVEIP